MLLNTVDKNFYHSFGGRMKFLTTCAIWLYVVSTVVVFGQTQIQRTTQLSLVGSIAGKVYSGQGGVLSGVRLSLKKTSDDTISKQVLHGAVTRSNGSFVIHDIPAGVYQLEARAVGFTTVVQRVEVIAGKTNTFNLTLKESSVFLQNVEVSASRRKQDQTDTRPSVIKIDPRESKFKAGAVEDVFRTLQTLPGIVAPSDFSSQLVIRGSSPDQNLILIDNLEVFNPYRLYGFISMFNPDIVSDIAIMTGGFPAQYGDRLSAVLDIKYRDGARDKGYISGKLNASIVAANGIIEGALPFWNGAYLVSARRTYYDLIAGPIARSTGAVDGDVALPNFRDLQAKFTVQPHSDHMVSLNMITSRDNTEFTSGASRERADSLSLIDRSFNDLIGLTWKWTPTDNFVLRSSASWYRNKGANTFGGSGGSQVAVGIPDLTRDQFEQLQDSLRRAGLQVPTLFSVEGTTSFNFQKVTYRTDATWRLGNHTLEFGANTDFITTSVDFTLLLDPRLIALRAVNPRVPQLPESFGSIIEYPRFAGYIHDNIRVTPQLTIQPGLRYDVFTLINKSYLAPRLSASYAFDLNTTLRAAYGIYYQSPGYEKLFDRSVFLDFTGPWLRELSAEKATHYVLGLERMITPEWQVRVEAYYKGFDNVILPQTQQGTVYTTTRIPGADSTKREGWRITQSIGDSLTTIPVNNATGESYGVEFLLQKIQSVGENTLYGWASYSLSWSNRFRNGLIIPFNFDRRHALNIVGGYKFAKNWDVNVTWAYGTGFPWTGALGVKPRITLQNDAQTGARTAQIDQDFRGLVFDVDRGGLENINQIRLPDYHRLDVRFTTYPEWFGLKWSVYLDIINIYNRTNVIAYNYRVDRTTNRVTTRMVGMLPILPTFGFSIEF